MTFNFDDAHIYEWKEGTCWIAKLEPAGPAWSAETKEEALSGLKRRMESELEYLECNDGYLGPNMQSRLETLRSLKQ